MPLIHAALSLGLYAGLRTPQILQPRHRRLSRRLLRAARSAAPCAETPEARLLAEQKGHLKISSWALSACLGQYAVPVLAPAAIALAAVSTIPVLRSAERSIRIHRRLRHDFLSGVVCVGSMGLGQPLAAAVQSWVLTFGEMTVLRSRQRARRLVGGALPEAGQVRVVGDDGEIELPLEAVHAGMLARVCTGDLIPVDGRVRDGSIGVDQQQLTGEQIPRQLGPGDEVFAGTMVVRGTGVIVVSVTGRNTALARIRRQLANTADQTSKMQLEAERLSDIAAPRLLAVAGLAWPLLGPSAAIGILFSMPMNSERACGARLVSTHLAALIENRVLIKDGRALEALLDVDTLVFDKTGTLTANDLTVVDVVAVRDWDRARILAVAAAAEGELDHPLARALRSACAADTSQINGVRLAVEDSAFRIGFGVSTHIDGKLVLVGGRRHLTAAGVSITNDIELALSAAEQRGTSVLLLASDGEVQGLILIEARIRPEVATLIPALRRRGIKHIWLVSGDADGPTRAVAERLGLDRYCANVLPEGKASIVRGLRAEGRRVLFVGDGVNDALAMQEATGSVSLHGASAVATDAARIILLDGDLSRLNTLLDAARTQRSHLNNMLGYWGGYAVVNTVLNLGYGIGVLPSSLLFGGAFGLGIGLASRPVPPQAPSEKTQSLPA